MLQDQADPNLFLSCTYLMPFKSLDTLLPLPNSFAFATLLPQAVTGFPSPGAKHCVLASFCQLSAECESAAMLSPTKRGKHCIAVTVVCTDCLDHEADRTTSKTLGQFDG